MRIVSTLILGAGFILTVLGAFSFEGSLDERYLPAIITLGVGIVCGFFVRDQAPQKQQ